VIECKDHAHKAATVAVKITRRGFLAYDQAARREIFILRDLKGLHGTPLLLRDFVHNSHVCLCFNFLGEDLKSALTRCEPTITIDELVLMISFTIFDSGGVLCNVRIY
jgi:hypothetical protein